MTSALDHGDGRGAFDLHVLQQAQVGKAGGRGEADAQPVWPDALRRGDQDPIDISTITGNMNEQQRIWFCARYDHYRKQAERAKAQALEMC